MDLNDSKKEYGRMMQKAMRLVAMRDHSVKEVSDKLFASCELPDVVSAVLNELIKNNYISDERFTENYVRSRKNRGFGPVKIQSELLSKGITVELAQRFLNPSETTWYDNALKQYQKKYDSAPIVDYGVWAKRARFLQGRGFNMDHIRSVLTDIDYS